MNDYEIDPYDRVIDFAITNGYSHFSDSLPEKGDRILAINFRGNEVKGTYIGCQSGGHRIDTGEAKYGFNFWKNL